MKPNKVFSLLGLATRAGRTASGEFMTEKSVKNKTAALVIVGTDASANTKKNFRDMCSFYHVPYYEYGTKEELGHGKRNACIPGGNRRRVCQNLKPVSGNGNEGDGGK